MHIATVGDFLSLRFCCTNSALNVFPVWPQVHVDDAMVNSGSLLEDMTPPINPPAEIDDPKDSKPSDWDDREKIPDPQATKVPSLPIRLPVLVYGLSSTMVSRNR